MKPTTISKLQRSIHGDLLALKQPLKHCAVEDAPPFTEKTLTECPWFTDSSAKPDGKWQYKAVALEISTGKQATGGGEASAQAGELRAVILAAQNRVKASYVDS